MCRSSHDSLVRPQDENLKRSKSRVVIKNKTTAHCVVLSMFALSGVDAVLPNDQVWLVTLEGGSEDTLYTLYGPMSRDKAIQNAPKATSLQDSGYMEVEKDANFSNCQSDIFNSRYILETEVTVPGMSGSKFLHITDVMAHPNNNLWHRESSGQFKELQKQHPINVQLHYGWKAVDQILQDAIDATFSSRQGEKIIFGDRVTAESGKPAFRLLQGKNYATGEQTHPEDPCRIPRNLEKGESHGDWQNIMLNLPSGKLDEIRDAYKMQELQLDDLDSVASENKYYEIFENRGDNLVSRVIFVDLEGLLELDD